MIGQKFITNQTDTIMINYHTCEQQQKHQLADSRMKTMSISTVGVSHYGTNTGIKLDIQCGTFNTANQSLCKTNELIAIFSLSSVCHLGFNA